MRDKIGGIGRNAPNSGTAVAIIQDIGKLVDVIVGLFVAGVRIAFGIVSKMRSKFIRNLIPVSRSVHIHASVEIENGVREHRRVRRSVFVIADRESRGNPDAFAETVVVVVDVPLERAVHVSGTVKTREGLRHGLGRQTNGSEARRRVDRRVGIEASVVWIASGEVPVVERQGTRGQLSQERVEIRVLLIRVRNADRRVCITIHIQIIPQTHRPERAGTMEGRNNRVIRDLIVGGRQRRVGIVVVEEIVSQERRSGVWRGVRGIHTDEIRRAIKSVAYARTAAPVGVVITAFLSE